MKWLLIPGIALVFYAIGLVASTVELNPSGNTYNVLKLLDPTNINFYITILLGILILFVLYLVISGSKETRKIKNSWIYEKREKRGTQNTGKKEQNTLDDYQEEDLLEENSNYIICPSCRTKYPLNTIHIKCLQCRTPLL